MSRCKKEFLHRDKAQSISERTKIPPSSTTILAGMRINAMRIKRFAFAARQESRDGAPLNSGRRGDDVCAIKLKQHDFPPQTGSFAPFLCVFYPTKWLQFNSIDVQIKPSASNVDASCYPHFPAWSERSRRCQAGQGGLRDSRTAADSGWALY